MKYMACDTVIPVLKVKVENECSSNEWSMVNTIIVERNIFV